MAVKDPIIAAWNNHEINLNEARVGLGLQPDPFFGSKYKFELFATKWVSHMFTKAASDEQKEDEAEFHDFIEKIRAVRKNDQEELQKESEKLAQALKKYFTELNTAIAKAVGKPTKIEKAKAQIYKVVNDKRHELSALLKSHLKSRVENIGSETERILKEKLRSNDPKKNNERFVRFDSGEWDGRGFVYLADEMLKDYLKRIVILTNESIKEQVDEGKYRDKMVEWYNSDRISTIVSNEMTRVRNLVVLFTSEQSGLFYKQWKTIGENCPFCGKLSGVNIKTGVKFARKGEVLKVGQKEMNIHDDIMVPPLHPHCDCIIIPGVKRGNEVIEKVKKQSSNPLSRFSHGQIPNLHPRTGELIVDANGITEKLIILDGTEFDFTPKSRQRFVYKNTEREIKVNGKIEKVKFEDYIYPQFDKWSDYETYLPMRHWQLEETQQFYFLRMELALEMKRDPKLKNKINQTALDVIRYGNHKKLRAKTESFFNKNEDLVKQLGITKQQIDDIARGKGSDDLYQKIKNNEKYKKILFDANEAWVNKANDPLGYTWHHHQEEGKMQLVKSIVHSEVDHVGGEKRWGGIRDNKRQQKRAKNE
ncbi:HNH endonuclease [Laceyella sacchari]|uniref:HNH endonuclease n=1 Tax=Laceyella sacchari TaxID=37482 RepID=UPI001FED1781|nr:HNH endonuclease [Laceyella sacchari]